MELSPKQQAIEIIKKSNRILISGYKSPQADCLGSILALGHILEKSGKEVSILIKSEIADNLKFLPYQNKILKEQKAPQDFIIKVDLGDKGVDKLSYNIENQNLNIIISPKKGNFSFQDVDFAQGKFRYDLVIILDTPDVEYIDDIFDNHTNLFFEVPVLNIDHHSSNENFGSINWVDLTATSTAEILVSLTEALGVELNTDTATCLLCGLIEDTSSFKNPQTTPKSLTVAAQLLAAGARKQEIVQNLFRSKNMATLKLWGKVLANIQHDPEHNLVWSLITYDDFQNSGANIDSLKDILHEMANSSKGDVVLLLGECQPNKISGKIYCSSESDIVVITELFGGERTFQTVNFELKDKNLLEALNETVEKVKRFQKQKISKEEFSNENETQKTTKPVSEMESLPESAKEIISSSEKQIKTWKPKK